MKKTSLVLIVLLTSHFLFSQHFFTGIYRPEDDTPRKELEINDNGTFRFEDYSDGSCWVWFRNFGTWRIKGDTLCLSLMDKVDSSIWRVSEFKISFNKLDYLDTSDKNYFTNWGAFKSTRFMDTKEYVIKRKSELSFQGIDFSDYKRLINTLGKRLGKDRVRESCCW